MFTYLVTTSFSIGFSIIFHIRKIFFQSIITAADEKIKSVCFTLGKWIPFFNLSSFIYSRYTSSQLAAFYYSFLSISLIQLCFIGFVSLFMIFWKAKRRNSKLAWLAYYKALVWYGLVLIFTAFYSSLICPSVSITLKYASFRSNYLLLGLIISIGSLLMRVNQSAIDSKIYTYENRSGALRLMGFYKIVLVTSFFVFEPNFLVFFLWLCILLWANWLVYMNQQRISDSKDYAIDEFFEKSSRSNN